MITRIFYSKSPANTINYVMNPKKQAEIALSKGINSLFNVHRIIMDFEKQSALRPSLEVKVIHIPTSFHARDLESVNAHGAEILQDWIDRMERHGYHFDQYFFGRHHDKDHKNPHFHFVGNLVLDDGSRANLANIGKAAREASIYVTQKWGLVSAKHLQEEILQEQKDAMKEYEKADYILSGQKNSGHSTSVSSYDSTDIMVVEDTSAPFLRLALSTRLALSQRCSFLIILPLFQVVEVAATRATMTKTRRKRSVETQAEEVLVNDNM